ncbi:MAG TPA: biotin--[acetyl-CoA-carboxylase] ligase [Nitrospirales bacterium]|jgi:BirA family biotin operon repressor/biotin-[acetyl-CoA-carboxylase] ligase|nr:biotin--[acetyl-CoA-carboxylase] ligase [Nitrospirales bacterium]HIB54713.1 biotin--[acetyl-CoA-carboxylase] ligase [Nitrospirales bacterium]HIN32400.1 biotin--[acetyl-CoA-carboxylase] ligase [Nitrospirales bacterium]HIO70265.1 biotin--[acetyl-CoA-carboxylase] ligase [Nitrospirales bacterium]
MLKTSMALGQPIHRFEEVLSTNAVALDLHHRGASEGTLVVADAQTRGRGRLGREWISPSGVNLYCSYILRAGNPEWISWVPLIASMAVASAIHAETELNARIKWPNDVLIEGLKVAGVLAETVSDGGEVQRVILGIGVNVNMPIASLPSSVQSTTTSLFEHLGESIDRNQLLTRLTDALDAQYQNFWNSDTSDIVREYLSISDTIGRRVIAHLPVGGPVEGLADGIESDGSLRLRRGQGDMEIIRSADIVHLR